MQPITYPLSPVRILLAEDDPDHQDILCRALTRGRPHVKVDRVASAVELDQAVRIATFDCIILDYNLPDQTADEAMKTSRYSLGQTPVVVVSSSVDKNVVSRSARAGGVDFVTKSDAMRGDALWERVSHAIDNSVARLDRNIAARLQVETRDRQANNLHSGPDEPTGGEKPDADDTCGRSAAGRNVPGRSNPVEGVARGPRAFRPRRTGWGRAAAVRRRRGSAAASPPGLRTVAGSRTNPATATPWSPAAARRQG